jgi:hypothetical protein
LLPLFLSFSTCCELSLPTFFLVQFIHTLKMKAAGFPRTLVPLYQTTLCHSLNYLNFNTCFEFWYCCIYFTSTGL